MAPVLSLYIARRLMLSIGAAFLILFALIFLVDFVDLIRNMREGGSATLVDVVLISLQRTPIIAEEVLPFTVLFGSIAGFVSLSRRLELVVARATGVSIWQMLAPALLAAAFLGIAATTVYNPVSTWLKQNAEEHEAIAFEKSRSNAGLRWIRQQDDDDQTIIRARSSTRRGQELKGVTAFIFSREGGFQARIEAETAKLQPDYWEMRNVRIMRHGIPPESHLVYQLPTNLTADQVEETVTEPEGVSFWQLPAVISHWHLTGLKTEKFDLRYQSLVARPIFFATMVLIAATVSLGFSRLGGVWKAILGGVTAGFMLYVAGEMAGDLGAAGFITPFVAAWSPSVIGMLLGVTVLLHQEDG